MAPAAALAALATELSAGVGTAVSLLVGLIAPGGNPDKALPYPAPVVGEIVDGLVPFWVLLNEEPISDPTIPPPMLPATLLPVTSAISPLAPPAAPPARAPVPMLPPFKPDPIAPVTAP